MIYTSEQAEKATLLAVANNMCVAARTAPKARAVDRIHTCIVGGEDLVKVADEMERIAGESGVDFLHRDAVNLRDSAFLVVIGTEYGQRGLKVCQYCQHASCGDCAKNNGVCVYDPIDLGVALGSAVSVAADARVDNRIFYSAGKAVLNLGIMSPKVKVAMGIPIAAWGKSPFVDTRAAKKK